MTEPIRQADREMPKIIRYLLALFIMSLSFADGLQISRCIYEWRKGHAMAVQDFQQIHSHNNSSFSWALFQVSTLVILWTLLRILLLVTFHRFFASWKLGANISAISSCLSRELSPCASFPRPKLTTRLPQRSQCSSFTGDCSKYYMGQHSSSLCSKLCQFQDQRLQPCAF